MLIILLIIFVIHVPIQVLYSSANASITRLYNLSLLLIVHIKDNTLEAIYYGSTFYIYSDNYVFLFAGSDVGFYPV